VNSSTTHELSIAHATPLETMQTGPAGRSAVSTRKAERRPTRDVKNLNHPVQTL
jgi:hypothetical protein